MLSTTHNATLRRDRHRKRRRRALPQTREACKWPDRPACISSSKDRRTTRGPSSDTHMHVPTRGSRPVRSNQTRRPRSSKLKLMSSSDPDAKIIAAACAFTPHTTNRTAQRRGGPGPSARDTSDPRQLRTPIESSGSDRSFRQSEICRLPVWISMTWPHGRAVRSARINAHTQTHGRRGSQARGRGDAVRSYLVRWGELQSLS